MKLSYASCVGQCSACWFYGKVLSCVWKMLGHWQHFMRFLTGFSVPRLISQYSTFIAHLTVASVADCFSARCFFWGPRTWKSQGSTHSVGLVTGYSTTAGRSWMIKPTAQISYPVISISLDPFKKQLVDKWFVTHKHEECWWLFDRASSSWNNLICQLDTTR